VRLRWPRRRGRSSWDVFAHAGEIFPTSPLVSPRRKVLVAEWVYLGMSWIAGAMWLAATPVFMVGKVEAGLALFGYGLSLLLLSLIPLAWALVKRRGRVAVPVRWTALGAVVLAVVPTVLAATVG
jgi:hypothetical protein